MGVLVNTVTVYTNYLLGKYMMEEEQQGADRAKYGAKILDSLSSYLTEEIRTRILQKQSGWYEKILSGLPRPRRSNCPIANWTIGRNAGKRNCPVADWTIEHRQAEVPISIELDALSGAHDN